MKNSVRVVFTFGGTVIVKEEISQMVLFLFYISDI